MGPGGELSEGVKVCPLYSDSMSDTGANILQDSATGYVF
jgi:hypothetical protein